MNSMQKRNVSYDLARVIICFMVVCAHINMLWKYDITDRIPWLTTILVDSFFVWAMPMLFMISGACSKGTDVNKYLKKIIKYFIIFIIVTILYSASDALVTYLIDGKIVINLFTTGFNTKYHLWFISQFILVLSIAPILNHVLERQEGLYKYIFILWAATCIVPTTLKCLFTGITYSKLLMIVSKAPTFLTDNYIGYYVLGKYMATKRKDNRINIPLNTILYIVLVFVLTFFTIAYTNRVGSLQEQWNLETNNLVVVIYSIVVFNFFNKVEIKNKVLSKISLLSKYTFFIYLMHPLIMDLSMLFGIPNYFTASLSMAPTLIKIPVLTLVIFIPTLLLAIIYMFFKDKIEKILTQKTLTISK